MSPALMYLTFNFERWVSISFFLSWSLVNTSTSTPEDDNYVKVGDNVKKGQTLCIIEAMKIMNEIESDVDGVLAEIKVDNGNPVEYNQVLFIINPA